MRHGTYDARGVFHQQTASLGVTQSGQCGFFTNGTLCWPISAELHAAFSNDERGAKEYIEQRGFAFVSSRPTTRQRVEV